MDFLKKIFLKSCFGDEEGRDFLYASKTHVNVSFVSSMQVQFHSFY